MDKKEVINENYYDNTTKKVKDFFSGFFRVLLLVPIVAFLTTVSSVWIVNLASFLDSGNVNVGFSILSFVVMLIYFGFLIKSAFKNNRRFKAFGIITGLSLPFLVYGACFSILL